MKTSKARENILSRIRKATSDQSLPQPYPEVEKDSSETVFPASELSDEENFASAFIKLGGKFIFCYNQSDLIDNLHALCDNSEWKEVVCSDKALLDSFKAQKFRLPVLVNESSPQEAEACITTCEALIGRTGSIIFSSKQFMGRTAPVYYPIHIVVAYSTQVVPDVQEGLDLMKKKYGNNLPSMINFNTGPSRTADIEKTLVVGVHGPAEVYCFYVDA